MTPALAAPVLAAALAGTVPAAHHDLVVRVDPEAHRIEVTDRLDLASLASEDDTFAFVLHRALVPAVRTPGWSLERLDGAVAAEAVGMNPVEARVPLQAWRLRAGDGADAAVEMAYAGEIHHPIEQQGREYQRSFSETPGIVDAEGVFLSGATYWVPTFADTMQTFRLEAVVALPGWGVVSQGRRTGHGPDEAGDVVTVWDSPHPNEEIYLVAGPWTEYADRAGDVELHAFLRAPDPALAHRYLQATKRYLAMYRRILPPYPYASFSLVENFWETGYGMPGFTLLGPGVIRLPFILTSSYPHEILHNWWGNSVYVDPDSGNWAEGLTAYMADHLFAEQRGEAAVYRRATLKKFTDFVDEGRDFPLAEFGSRDSPATEAVGYGKSLMLFHMVRRALGNDGFVEAMARAAEDGRFRRIGFDDLAAHVSAVAGRDFGPWFDAWVTRPGAPEIDIARVEARPAPAGSEAPWEVVVALRQRQDAEPFPVDVPLAVTVEGHDGPVEAELTMTGREAELTLACPGRPLRVDVDPRFDCMRRLDPLEVPPALSTLFADDAPLFVLPAAAGEDERAAWVELAARWSESGEPRTVLDRDLDALPPGAVWLLGWNNTHGPRLAERLEVHGVSIDADSVAMGGESIARAGHSTVLVARHPGDPRLAVGWVTADPVDAVPGLARKLPHYTRYSYLAFRGDEPGNVAKGMWTPLDSPLSRKLVDGPVPELRLPERRPLAELPPAFDAAAMGESVAYLASPSQLGRGLGSAGLWRATDWVESRFRAAGLRPAGADGYGQSWTWIGGEPARRMTLTNVLGRLDGTDDALADHPVIVMAHLDHIGMGWPDVRGNNAGKIHPGADDNASGVAVLVAVAEAMAAEPRRPRPVLFAAVTGEEAGRLGSRRLLESLEHRAPFACVNLDTVGRLRDGKLYVINSDSAREWRFIFMGVQYTTGLASTLVTEPLDSSDQVSCLEAGVPAVQLFTGPHGDYHRPGDTAERVDVEGMTRIAEVVHEVAGYLAERVEPLTVTLPGAEPEGQAPKAAAPEGSRRVSLGTVPDFAYPGPGVLVSDVLPGSAAEAAGMLPGDVVETIDGDEVADLRGYSTLLKRYRPGDTVEIVVERDGARVTVRATLAAR